MADQQFPGFEGEDEEQAKKPAPHAKPPTSSTAKPGTGKVAKDDGVPPPLQGAGKVEYAFEESAEPEPKKKPAAQPAAKDAREPTPATLQPVLGEKKGTGRTAKAAPPRDEEPADPDLKPGSRKDLWNCPHCGAGNKPGRPTCRTCGKNPDDPVETPWFKKPPIIGAAAGGLILLIVIIVLCSGTDTSLHPAEVGSIDGKPRVGGSASEGHDVDSKTFTARRKFSVVGRCAGAQASSSLAGSTTVVLLLGKAGARDLPTDAKVNFNGDITEFPDAPGKFLILHLLGPPAKNPPARGAIVSLAGDVGELEGGSSWGSGESIVWVEELRSGE